VVDEIESILEYGFTRINIADDRSPRTRRGQELCAETGGEGEVRVEPSAR
jgi:hypothetical protein